MQNESYLVTKKSFYDFLKIFFLKKNFSIFDFLGQNGLVGGPYKIFSVFKKEKFSGWIFFVWPFVVYKSVSPISHIYPIRLQKSQKTFFFFFIFFFKIFKNFCKWSSSTQKNWFCKPRFWGIKDTLYTYFYLTNMFGQAP